MAPILRKGDKIHLAFHVSLVAARPQDEAVETANYLTKKYKEQGVEVVLWTASSATTKPEVVAIFRDEP